jgi:bifunctional DNA-binding transcriptional regulator/antitoxin component of YhaV-PrlF toxin-antitoxin module
MARTVKNLGARRRSGTASAASSHRVPRPTTGAAPKPLAKTRISSKHQITIAKEAFEAAGFHSGDVVAVRAVGPGRVELTRLEELFAKHRGRVKGGAGAREAVERLRDEWL